MHRFFAGWLVEPGGVSFEDFFPAWLGGGPGGTDYFTHLLSWYARRDQADTLLDTYGHASGDRPAMIRRLAAFLDLSLTDEGAAIVEEMTSRDFMHAHKDRFDDHMLCEVLTAGIGIPADSDSSKVQAKGSDGDELPQSVRDRIAAMWAERVEPVTGHADFDALAAAIEGSR
jgi:hypothetical protein